MSHSLLTWTKCWKNLLCLCFHLIRIDPNEYVWTLSDVNTARFPSLLAELEYLLMPMTDILFTNIAFSARGKLFGCLQKDDLSTVLWNLFMKHKRVSANSIISQDSNVGRWLLRSLRLICVANTMAATDLATQGPNTSAPSVLDYIVHIPYSTSVVWRLVIS